MVRWLFRVFMEGSPVPLQIPLLLGVHQTALLSTTRQLLRSGKPKYVHLVSSVKTLRVR